MLSGHQTMARLCLVLCFFSVIQCRVDSDQRYVHRQHRVKHPNHWFPDRVKNSSVEEDFSVNFLPHLQGSSRPIVHTSWATIQGTTESFADTNVSVFYGIPFAMPPVGKLRFRRPVPLEGRYLGVYNATEAKPACYQGLGKDKVRTEPVSEDCLYLNVWVPREEPESFKRSKWLLGNARRRSPGSRGYPVIFYIYGSQFKKHSATYNINRGGATTGLGRYIFVNFNYRLQSFGFAYGNDKRMPGNQALYDVLAALDWTRKNIADFGGDPDHITISGSSAGSILVGMIALSPKVSHFHFDRALMMSCVPVRPTSLESVAVALNKTKALAAKFGCLKFPNHDFKLSQDQIDCLQKVNASKLAVADTEADLISMGNAVDFAFMPVYGDEFMPMKPDEYLKRGEVRRDIEYMVGSDHYDDVETGDYVPASRAEAEAYLNHMFEIMVKPTRNISRELNFIYASYFKGVHDNDSWALKEAFSQIIGDNVFQCPLLLFTEKWALTNPIHMYYNVYPPESYRNSTEPKKQHGPGHGMANFMFMGCPFMEHEKFTDKDRLVSAKMISLLSDFVYEGKAHWPPVLAKQGKVLPLQWMIDESVDPRHVRVNPKTKMCRLFDSLYHIFY